MTDAEQVHPQDARAWHDWLAEHHDQPDGVWVVTWRSGTGRQTPSYEELVLEALCFGWIDGQMKPLDDERSMQWFTRRRTDSPWSGSNKRRVARLEEEGRMRPPGRAMIEQAKATGTWTVLDDAEALIEPAELSALLDATPGARTHWDSFPPSARKIGLTAIALAKQPETRTRRIESIVAQAARNERP